MLTPLVFSLCIVALWASFFTSSGAASTCCAPAEPVELFDRIPERIQALLVYRLRAEEVRPPRGRASWASATAGWMHFFIFWGFTILGVQVVTMFGRAFSDRLLPAAPRPGPARRAVPAAPGPHRGDRAGLRSASRSCAGRSRIRRGSTASRPPEDRLRQPRRTGRRSSSSCCIGIIMLDGPPLRRRPHLAPRRRSRRSHARAPLGAGRRAGRSACVLAALGGRRGERVGDVGLVGPQPGRPRHAELPAALEALPHHHRRSRTCSSGSSSRSARSRSRTSRTPRRFGTSHIDQFTWKQVLDMYTLHRVRPLLVALSRRRPPASRWRRASCCSICATTSTSTRTR